MTERTALLFMTHRWDAVMRLKYERLRREIGGKADVFALVDHSEAVMQSLAQWPPETPSVALFGTGGLAAQLGYPMFGGNSLESGSTHFPALLFALNRREYDRFLVIEYDVDFSGDWAELFDEAAAPGIDFAAMHFRSYGDEPDWHHWSSTVPSGRDREWASQPANLKRSFNPLYCITRPAFELVHQACLEGWQAHFEILLPTVLARAGCRFLDLAENERFCVGSEQDVLKGRSPQLSTFRWRPCVTPNEFLARSTGRTLFHPIKQPWCYDGAQVVTVQAGAEGR